MKAGIAGAGILGRLLAFALLQAGWQVTLFDKSDKENASFSAAGLLTPITELEKNDQIIFHLGMEALYEHWPKMLSQLNTPIYFKQLGSLVISHPRDQVELTRFIDNLSVKMNLEKKYQLLSCDELKCLEPELSKFQIGYYFSAEGQIDTQSLLSILEQYLIDKIDWSQDTWVSEVKPGKIIVNDQTLEFDYVFDCRGLGAKSRFNDLRGVRGELIWLYAPDIVITRPIRFLHPRYSLYIVPRPGHIYLLGASEIESEDNSAISVLTTLELLTAAYYIQPKFSEARIIKTITQCRPTLANHLPKIKYLEGLIAINGLYRHGFLIAPTLVYEVMQFIQNGLSTCNYPQLWENEV